jgi:hypothetical protein
VSSSQPPPPFAGAQAGRPSPELRERVLAAVRTRQASPLAGGARRHALAVVLAVLCASGVSLAIGLPGLRGRPLAYVASLAVAWMLVGVAATWAGVSRGRSMLGRTAGWRIAAATLTPVALLATSTAVGMAWPQTLLDRPAVDDHLFCVVGTVALAFGPLAAFLAIRRSSDPVSPYLTGAAIGAAAGAWGALGIELHCRYTSPWHVFLGHVMPVALLVGLGVAAGSRLVAIRGENG